MFGIKRGNIKCCTKATHFFSDFSLFTLTASRYNVQSEKYDNLMWAGNPSGFAVTICIRMSIWCNGNVYSERENTYLKLGNLLQGNNKMLSKWAL